MALCQNENICPCQRVFGSGVWWSELWGRCEGTCDMRAALSFTAWVSELHGVFYLTCTLKDQLNFDFIYTEIKLYHGGIFKMSDLVSDYKSCFANKKTLEFPQQKKGAAGPYCSQNHCAQRAMWVSLWFFCGGIWREHLKYGKMETIIRLEMNSICGWTWDNLILNSHFCDWNTVILCHISSTIQSLV